MFDVVSLENGRVVYYTFHHVSLCGYVHMYLHVNVEAGVSIGSLTEPDADFLLGALGSKLQ